MSEVTAVPLRPVGKSGIVTLWVGIAALIAAGGYAAYAGSQKAVLSSLPPEKFLAENGRRAGVHTTASGIEYEVLKAGSGPHPTTADIVQVEYAGRLVNGTQFDATQKGQPAAMPVARVVPGFAEALTLMPRGAKYRVWIPPQLAYGDREAGPIPANSVLVFDIVMHDFMAVPPGMSMGGLPGQ